MNEAPTLADVAGRIRSLPAMPTVALELLHTLTETDASSADLVDLARRIAQDQAITARVLRVANSPFYGLQSRVASINDAIVVLGFSAVRSLVLAAAVMASLPGGPCTGFSQERFWRHVLGTAAAAQAIGKRLGRPSEALFIAGLLHDIGRLALVVLYPARYAATLAAAREQDRGLQETELAFFGFDHAAVGASLAEHWHFPAEIADALAWHHQPDRGKAGGLAAIVHYADAIAQALDLDESEDSQVARLQEDAVASLGLDWDALLAVLADTQTRFDSYRLMLG
ncbi:HDOD domain-containing protein [Zoogloea sp. LCSB751]|uniref:HDOD domain-containing protein n=1 Tax=Zoogloea sp. LCSB751 TaxID=1965277 RepID=UPI0009A50D84|nr:HDOD domain-containing protein [Zoogloea sp. LCSB751]